MFHLEPTPLSLNKINIASQAFLLVLFRRILMKIEKCNSHLWFLSRCRKQQLTPKFINIKCISHSSAARKALAIAKTSWMT